MVVLPDTLAGVPLKRLALLLDIDGTLSPIVADADEASVPEETLDLLREFVNAGGCLGVVTGRDLATASRMVPLERVWVAAGHGMHLRRPDGREEIDAVATAARPQLDLAVRLAQTVGWRYEDKGQAVTIHFRHAESPELTARGIRAQMSTVLDPRVVGIHDARMALEVRPVGSATKRNAVLAMLEGADVDAVAYLGDDRTDLDAFAAIAGLSGVIGLCVAVDSDEAPAALVEGADLVLSSQNDVAGFLAAVLEGHREGASGG